MGRLLRVVCVAVLVWAAPAVSHADYEFNFARVRFDGGWEWPRWRADWPEAETHFSLGLARLTRIDNSPGGQVVLLDEDAIFEYPWLYVVEVGYMQLSQSEAANLREYLLRGGFLMVDDFHGSYEWQNFVVQMKKVFPEKTLQRLGDDSEAFHVVYDLGERAQIPGIRSILAGRTWEKGGIQPGWFAISDEHDRIMVAVNFNQDIGDAWEHADDAVYPEPYTAMAYRLGINYIVYAMTH